MWTAELDEYNQPALVGICPLADIHESITQRPQSFTSMKSGVQACHIAGHRPTSHMWLR